MPSKFHLAKDAFSLQLLFKCAESLINVVVANEDLHRLIDLSGHVDIGPAFYHAMRRL